MRRNAAFWLALLAAGLAGATIIGRLIRGSGDLLMLSGSAGIILFMITIMVRNRPGQGGRTHG